ncbi:response regulator transcription factor [Kangiella sp. TOML190]|uniref:response regulator transcription factor n=1 Tax=Kangiella sp. TOML190 TaxID=2931351 RepID=UPI00203DA0BD|nr:response regulator transcription factor [Kangiella sp. TOML190]
MLDCKILLIEDDLPLAELIQEYLEAQGYRLKHLAKGLDVHQLADDENFDLILCDVMLPDIDGFNLNGILQEKFQCPIIFLTALSDDEDQIKGLELGAIDYIVKPVEPNVLLARIRANLRKNQSPVSAENITISDLTLDKHKQVATLNGSALDLTSQDFELLWIFAQNQGKILSREFLFQAIIGREYNGLDRTVDARTSRLRKKIEDFNVPGLVIRTVWGKGYLFTYTKALG